MFQSKQTAIGIDREVYNLRTSNTDATDKHFTDIDQHWAKAYLLNLIERGIISDEYDKDVFHPDATVSTEQFVSMLLKGSKGNIETEKDEGASGYMDYALHKGIIEDYDVTNRCKPIQRRSAARIVREALLTEFGESDQYEWSAAEKLKDLYSCHTCVMHIAQVYVKGIMLERFKNVFDVMGSITLGEAAEIIVRVLDKEQRVPQTSKREVQSLPLSPEEALELMHKDRTVMLIDVRTHEEYLMGHIEGSISIPLVDISNNPYSVCVDKDTPIILYCQKGYKSSIAGQILSDAGYSRIYTLPGVNQYGYYYITS